MFDKRPWLRDIINAALIGLSAFLAIRFGIQLPPIQIPPSPPITVIPPPVVIPPIGGAPTQPVPPTETPPDPLNAIVQISAPGVGCSATIIGPRRADGRYWVLSASHCVNGLGQHWTARFRNGRTIGLRVVNYDRKPDYSWLLTESNTEALPYALLADKTPEPGTPIWHAGFGIDRPGNRENGQTVSGPDANGQIRMKLSVSSGDSGGGIIIDKEGKVVSSVCCTAGRGFLTDTWGTSVEAARQGQVEKTGGFEWSPLEVPLKMPDKK